MGERRFVTTELTADGRAIIARNTYNADFRDRVAFLSGNCHRLLEAY